MPQLLIYLLLALALVVPVLGTIVLRLLSGRISEHQLIGSAGVLFGIAGVSVLILAFGNISSLRVGNLTLLLPLPGAVSEAELQPAVLVPPQTPLDDGTALPAEPATATSPPLTPDVTTPAATGTATPTATASVTATPAPTLTATAEPPTPTPEPPSATPEPPPAEPAAPRTYTVEPGDTLRGIAEEFGVSVEAILEANGLSPEEGDALSVGQELIIP